MESERRELLVVTFNYSRPIELTDFAESMLGIAHEYRRYLSREEPEAAHDNVRLCVNSVRSGSIIAELIPYGPLLLPFISHVNTVFSFAKHIKTAYDYLLGESDSKPELDSASYQSLANILEPVAKDNGSNLILQTTVNGNLTLNIGSLQANAIQNALQRAIGDLKEPAKGIQNKVVLYWYQARKGPSSGAGDRAIIESISPSPVKVIFSNEITKALMILTDDNPFKHAYVVDVMVSTVRDKPVLYSILAVHDSIAIEDS